MSRKRAQITEETTGRLYRDVLDRIVDEEPPKHSDAQALQPQAPANGRIKVTVYLNIEDVLVIDRAQSSELIHTGKRPERSHIVSRAIQLLAQTMKED